MNPLEAADLLTFAAAFDNRHPSVAANTAWAKALHDVPFDQDAVDAVTAYYSEPGETGERRWLQPHHVRHHRQLIRNQRIPDGVLAYRSPDPDESGSEFLRRRRAQLQAVADGAIAAEEVRQIDGGPHPTVLPVLERIGQIPDHIRAELAEVGIGTRRTRWPELAVPCPLHACRALAWRPCKLPSGTEMRQGTHPSRRDAWVEAGSPAPEAS